MSLCHDFNTSGWPANTLRTLRSLKLWCISGDICTICTGWMPFYKVVRPIRILLITINYSRLNKFKETRISFFFFYSFFYSSFNLYHFIEIVLLDISEHENEKARRTGDSDIHNQYPDRGQRRLGWTSAVGSTISLLWRRKSPRHRCRHKQCEHTWHAKYVFFFFFSSSKENDSAGRVHYLSKVNEVFSSRKKKKGSII